MLQNRIARLLVNNQKNQSFLLHMNRIVCLYRQYLWYCGISKTENSWNMKDWEEAAVRKEACSKYKCSWLLLSINTLQKLFIEVLIQDNFLFSTKEKTQQVQSLTTATVQYKIHILAMTCLTMFVCLYKIVGEESNFHIVTVLVKEKKMYY